MSAHKMGVKKGAKISDNWYSHKESNIKKAAERICGDIYAEAVHVWCTGIATVVPPGKEPEQPAGMVES